MKTTPTVIRRSVQVFFSGILCFIGARFYLFVSCLEKGGLPGFERPAGVEAFLPISALISLKHWLYTGTINSIHPSALVLFLIICVTAFVAKKGFCSWICPIGLLSDGLAGLNKKLFKKPLRLPAVLDLLLRSLKYLMTGFFLYQIFFKMPARSIEQFIHSPYNQFADIKMLEFFTEMSTTALIVLSILIGLTLLVRNFWCRYLCPYGALLGMLGLLSLGKVHRQPAQCTRCGRCETVCPGRIAIRQKRGINSPECSSCLACVDACLEKNALSFTLFSGRRSLAPTVLAGGFILVFTLGITAAKLSGHWQNDISPRTYLRYLHPGTPPSGTRGLDYVSPEKMQRMLLRMQQLRAQ